MSILGGLFGGGGNSLPVYTSDNTSELTTQQMQEMQRAYTISQGVNIGNSTTVLLSETGKLLTEVRDELKPLKEWLIATYPDIYEQYRAVETLRQIGREK